jgi:hypothetical protein
MAINQCIPVKNTLSLRAVIPCEGELLLLCEMVSSAILYLVTVGHNFDSRRVISCKPKNGRPVGNTPNGGLCVCFFCKFRLDTSSQHPRCQTAKAVLLSED